MRVLPLLSCLVLFASCLAFSAEPILIWPGEAPGEKGGLPEQSAEVDDKQVERTKNVSVPSFTVYEPAADKKNGTAVLILPGGGYNILASSHEGTDVATWLNGLGVTAFMLKYRVPRREGRLKHEAPLQDAQRCLSIIRSRASEWDISSDKIGLLGFSAGGHLCCATGTNHDKRSYEVIDDMDQQSCRPDFLIPIYPAYLMNKEATELAPEIRVTKTTPPTFLCVTNDDSDRGIGAARFYIACRQNKVPAECHVFLKGGHGYGMHDRGFPVNKWYDVCGVWMQQQGLIPDDKK